MEPIKHMSLVRFFQAIGISVILFISLYALDGDPAPLKLNADLVDEAVWIHNARSKVLFGSYVTSPDYINYAGLGGPLFNFILCIFFQLGGVSLISARFLSVLSFWSILVFIYFIFRCVGYSRFKSTLPCLILGLNHQSLIFARWATPISLQMLWLTLAFYLPLFVIRVHSKSQRKQLLFLSGLAFSAAIASKGTGISLIPAYLANVLFLWLIARRFIFFDLVPIFLGAFSGLLGLVAVFYINAPFLKLLKIFILNFNAANQVKSIISLLKTIAANPGMANPMTAILCAGGLATLALRGAQALNLRTKYIFSINWKQKDLLEWTSFIWLISGHIGLLIFREFTIYRRYIQFLIPLTIIFSRFLFGLNDNLLFIQSQKSKFWIGIVLGAALSFYFYQSEIYTNRVWLSQAGFPELSFFHNNLWPNLLLILLIPLFLFFIRGRRILSILLVSSILSTNLYLSYHWLESITFTLRDESRRFGKTAALGDIATGYSPWTLCTESPVLPIYYNKGIRYKIDDLTNFPKSLPSREQNLFLLKLTSNIGIDEGIFDPFLVQEDFKLVRAEPLGVFRLMPYSGTSRYRMVYQITKISPAG